MKIYLSGGMRSGWQQRLKKLLRAWLRNMEKNVTYYDPTMHGLDDSPQYTFWDLEHIRKCDLVFAYMERDNPSGIGLALEVGYALGLGKPIILVNESERPYFDIVENAASVTTDNFEKGVFLLQRMLL